MDDTSVFRVVEDFLSIQGEGYHSGTLAQFIRLQGCNSKARGLDCLEWCDTDYETLAWSANVPAFENWFEYQPHAPLLVFTGGEPLLYQHVIEKWIYSTKSLQSTYNVCIETNGTVPRTIVHPKIWYTVSPKGPEWSLGESKVSGAIHEVKLVVTPWMLDEVESTLDLMDTLTGSWYCFLQPQDNRLDHAKEIVEKLIPRRPHWRLSLQTHKLLQIQ